jgi:hypothetical protein
MAESFIDSIDAMRRRARQRIEQGAVIQSYEAPLDTVIPRG